MDAKDAPITSKTEHIIQNIVGCGPFQVTLFTSLFGLSMLSNAFFVLIMTFGLYNPGWRCLDPNNTSQHDVINTTTTSFPVSSDPVWVNGGMPSNQRNETMARNNANVSTDYITEGHCSLFDSCSRIEFKPGTSTIVTEWGLLCDKAWIAKMIISIQYAGKLLGTMFAGYVGDRIGRKTTIYGAQALVTVFSTASIFSTTWIMFAAFRFLIGLSSAGVLVFYYVYTMELVTTKWRGPIPNIPYWPVVSIVFSLTCWWLKDWQDILIVAAVISGVSMLPALWLPESPRWLEVKNKKTKFEHAFRKIAKMNGKPLPPFEDIYKEIENENGKVNAAFYGQTDANGKSTVRHDRGKTETSYDSQGHEKSDKNSTEKDKVEARKDGTKSNDDETRYNMFHLFKPAYRKYTLLLAVPRFAVSLIFFALGFGVKELSGDFYINSIIVFAFEIPFSPVSTILPNVIGRKLSAISLSLSSGVCLLAAACCHQFTSGYASTTGVLVLAIGARVTISSFWGVLMTYTAEIYPTVVRGLGESWGTIMMQVGGIVAPFLIPDTESSFFICYVVMSVIAILCTGVFFFLPETKGRKLRDSFEQSQDSSP